MRVILHLSIDPEFKPPSKDGHCFQNMENMVGAYFRVSRRVNANYNMSRHWIWAVVLATGMLFSALPGSGRAATTQPAPFVIGTDDDPNEFGSRWVFLIYTEAFKRLGIPLELGYFPLARRTAFADSGVIDGDAARVYAYGDAHPNLIRVEESVVDLAFALYTANPTVRLQRLDELPGSTLLVEYRRGILICEKTLKSLVTPERLSDVTSEEQGLKKLLAGRTDLYCDFDIPVQKILHSPGFKSGTSVRKVIDLGKPVPTFPYLHKKHAELAPRLGATLKKMKAEGLIEAYRLQVEREQGWTK